MPGSCSSNSLNGCAACGPSLVLFYISASTSREMVGLSCLDGSAPNPPIRYFSKNISANETLYGATNIPNCPGSLTTNVSYTYTENMLCLVDAYGEIICSVSLSSFQNSSMNGLETSCADPKPINKSGSVTCSKKARKTSCEEEPETECIESDWCAEDGGCASYSCVSPCTTAVSCTKYTENGKDAYDYVSKIGGIEKYYRFDNSSNYKTTIASSKTLSYFYDLCKSSVSKKMDLLKNNGPQNCDGDKCGSGGKDDCWGGGGCFTISANGLSDPNSNSATAQELKFKVATIKEGFDKKYKSVSGKVKYYISSDQDIEENRNPCCNSDFSGTVVKEAGYSISAGETFKNDYLASDAGDFNNSDQSHVGEAICPCITIDNVSFV
jgi:hypothetical protein